MSVFFLKTHLHSTAAREPFPKGFMLPWDTPKYDGTTKPEDWLID